MTVSTFQQGVSGYAGWGDGYLYRAGGADDNFGAATEMLIYVDGLYDRRGIWKLDLTGIPTTDVVSSAILSLVHYQGTDANETIEVRAATRAWGVGTSNNVPEVGACCWSHSVYDTVAWTTAGGDFSGTSSGSCTVAATGTKNLDITALVAGWAATPASNLGAFLIQGVAPAAATTIRFRSSDYATAGDRPLVTVTHTPASSRRRRLLCGGA